MINGAQDDDATILSNKTEVGIAFADAGMEDVTEAKSMMSGITYEYTTVTLAITTITGSTNSVIDTYPNYTMAKSNGLQDLSKVFNGLQVMVTTDTPIDAVSAGTTAIYGTIQNQNTKALLKLNGNYPTGSKFVVKVYNQNKLVAISEELALGSDVINFGSLL